VMCWASCAWFLVTRRKRERHLNSYDNVFVNSVYDRVFCLY
jgi:hypothetical protein